MMTCLGATVLDDNRCRFLVWAPHAKRVEIVLLLSSPKVVATRRQGRGYHQAVVIGVKPGTRYLYRLDGQRDFPDPASRSQPDGVHGASAVADPAFAWSDQGWAGMPLHDCILYELHVGAFTPEGTFAAVARRLVELKELGITALELMPVVQFPGGRNWGYDGAYPYAVQNTYGGPGGLKRLVNAAHEVGLAVVLDVVYNHVGPEGNHLGEFGPYFTDAHHTPWGPALNFNGPYSSEVRRFFIENALCWQKEFHIDALRLDAICAIRDSSAVHFLEALGRACRRQAGSGSRPFYLIGESGLDIVRHVSVGRPWGSALDAEWRDDFHHCLHVLLTREQTGYYARFGGVEQFARVWRAGGAAKGGRANSSKRRHGALKGTLPTRTFVVFGQNHDQVGNRLRGERLAALVSFEARKLAAATVLLSPFVPLLFMGEEYGETAPFNYFVSHSSPALIQAVRNGRRMELAAFGWRGRPPDPQAASNFQSSKLTRDLVRQPRHRLLLEFYRELIRLRRTVPALVAAKGDAMRVRAHPSQAVLLVHISQGGQQSLVVFNYSDRAAAVSAAAAPGRWLRLLDSASRRWGGPGSRVPDELLSRGRATLSLRAKSVAALARVPRSKPESDRRKREQHCPGVRLIHRGS